jgi:hypothetical protein
MSCHASVLVGGHSPHPPHTHREEELLIPLHGEAEIVIATSPTDPSPRVDRPWAGDTDAHDRGRQLRGDVAACLREGVAARPNDRRGTVIDGRFAIRSGQPGAVGLDDGGANARAAEVEGKDGRA